MQTSVRRLLGWFGASVAGLFFIWFVVGLFDPVPSVVDVFGDWGVRTPASITILALLIAAIGFWEE